MVFTRIKHGFVELVVILFTFNTRCDYMILPDFCLYGSVNIDGTTMLFQIFIHFLKFKSPTLL